MDFTGKEDFKESWGKANPNRYGYIKLYTSGSIPTGKPAEIKVTSTGYPDSLNWDDFATSAEQW